MMAALYAAFWLQLESASSAAVCVAILALPSRGQAFEKAFYRFLGTVVGGIASIAIAGLFNGARDLFIVAFAGWMAACVYAASMLDGNRAYGAVLSGYTVGIVAVQDIDAPQNVFSTGISRCAAITVGIAALMLLHDLLAAPDVLPGLLERLEAAQRRVTAFSRGVISRGVADPDELVSVLEGVAQLHPDVSAMRGESVKGRARAAAAGRALASLSREAAAAWALGVVLPSLCDADRARVATLAAGIGDQPAAGSGAADLEAEDARGGGPAGPRFAAASAGLLLLEQGRVTADAIADVRSGRGPSLGPRLPPFRSHEAALRNALRVFIGLVLGAAFFAGTGWPATSTALFLLGSTAGLSATNPNPGGFAKGALVAMPIAALIAGVTEFLLLDGVDAFPLLALGMAPGIIGAALLLAGGRPPLAPVGFLILVFFPVLLGPSNPQSYDPRAYLTISFMSIAAVIALFVVLSAVLPTSDERKRAWILRSMRRDCARALERPRLGVTPDEIAFRDADRISQLGGLASDAGAARLDGLRNALDCAALTSSAWSVRAALADERLPAGAEADGRDALALRDPARLRRSATCLMDGGEGGAARRAAAALAMMAALLECSPEAEAAGAGSGSNGA